VALRRGDLHGVQGAGQTDQGHGDDQSTVAVDHHEDHHGNAAVDHHGNVAVDHHGNVAVDHHGNDAEADHRETLDTHRRTGDNHPGEGEADNPESAADNREVVALCSDLRLGIDLWVAGSPTDHDDVGCCWEESEIDFGGVEVAKASTIEIDPVFPCFLEENAIDHEVHHQGEEMGLVGPHQGQTKTLRSTMQERRTHRAGSAAKVVSGVNRLKSISKKRRNLSECSSTRCSRQHESYKLEGWALQVVSTLMLLLHHTFQSTGYEKMKTAA
jgi:hypothetical protein